MKKYLLLILLFLVINHDIYADCLACWETQAVEITLHDDSTKEGVILWNNSWAHTHYFDKRIKLDEMTEFCDTIYYTLTQSKETDLIVYHNVVTFKQVLPKTPMTYGDTDTINLDLIHSIKRIQSKNNKLQGAGPLVIIDKYQATLLENKPMAKYITPGAALSDAYYFSYDPEIKEEELIRVVKSGEALPNEKLFMIAIHYD